MNKYTLQHMKKNIVLVALAGLVALNPLLAKGETGIGFVAGGPTGLTFKRNNFPVIEIGWNLIEGGHLDVNIDYWIFTRELVSPIDWYLGVGGAFRYHDNKNATNDSFGGGVRIPVGLQWMVTGDVEIFAEAAPTMALLPGTNFSVDGSFGIRFYVF